MSNNAPPFDPLNPTPEEEADMVKGYMEAGPNGPGFRPWPTTFAYEHGWRCRRNDMAGVADDDQRELARRLAENQAKAAEIREDAEDRRTKLRAGLRGPTARYKP